MKRAISALCILLALGSIAQASGRFVNITPKNMSEFTLEFTLEESIPRHTKDQVGVKLTYSPDQKSLEDLFATKLHISDGTQSIAVVPLGVKKDKKGMVACILRINRQHLKHSMVVLSCGKEGLKEIHYQVNLSEFVKTKENANK